MTQTTYRQEAGHVDYSNGPGLAFGIPGSTAKSATYVYVLPYIFIRFDKRTFNARYEKYAFYHPLKSLILTFTTHALVYLKVAYTSGPIFEKIMKRYPIFSVQIINYQIDQKYK